MENDAFQNGSTGNFQHGFGDILRQGAKPRSLTTRHDHRPVGSLNSAQKIMKLMQTNQAFFLINHRHLLESSGLHNVQNFSATDRW